MRENYYTTPVHQMEKTIASEQLLERPPVRKKQNYPISNKAIGDALFLPTLEDNDGPNNKLPRKIHLRMRPSTKQDRDHNVLSIHEELQLINSLENLFNPSEPSAHGTDRTTEPDGDVEHEDQSSYGNFFFDEDAEFEEGGSDTPGGAQTVLKDDSTAQGTSSYFVSKDDGGNLSRSPSSVMLFDQFSY
eukprot:CAMPEP_0194315290 /NCGR_PEP_ID=MMETSP0171-20130528/12087_1 /TAXON_ID=218684 /ORGANISM="Corethron pennatum, Strain L29A3" /LENGTH=188 /DNA_ID=CAMNT_0039071045 /DNA_START=93 /DNA_END=659 /DNA_ORIENTATION=+